jgi:hypothetical protein
MNLDPGAFDVEPDLDDLLQAAQTAGATVASAGWRDGLRDFYLQFSNGQGILFRDCLQASLLRSPGAQAQPFELGGWWTDEPSPLLASLGPEIRLLYHHLVLEVGEALLRVAYRSLESLADPTG